ncbi:MAG: hypothetical protein KF743_14170 [Fimbriimonadaceae bacterium]|nr:hypothetical protein [Fimbriimonadaceae bacterium]
MSKRVTRRIVLLDASRSAVVHADPAWEEEHWLYHRCPECSLWRDDVRQTAIDTILVREPKWLIATTGLFDVVYKPLADVVLPYGKGVLSGTCRLGRTGKLLKDWVTIYSRREDMLVTQRGRYARHRQCPECGAMVQKNGWAHPAVVERDLGKRWLYLDRGSLLFADVRLVEKERLAERFPKLKFYPIPVLAESLSGEVLPGDPEWTGTFKELRLPTPPKSKPEKGIGLWL